VREIIKSISERKRMDRFLYSAFERRKLRMHKNLQHVWIKGVISEPQLPL